jgi:hypothetical protein
VAEIRSVAHAKHLLDGRASISANGVDERLAPQQFVDGECRLRAKTGREQRQQNRDYSITSSASSNIGRGTVRPIAFAAFKLIVTSNLVGDWTALLPSESGASLSTDRWSENPAAGQAQLVKLLTSF